MDIEEKLRKEFKEALDGCLECVNGEGQIKRVDIDLVTMEVKFVFDIHKIEDEFTFLLY